MLHIYIWREMGIYFKGKYNIIKKGLIVPNTWLGITQHTGKTFSAIMAKILFSNHRITECSGLAGRSVGHPAQTPAQAGSPRAGCTGPWPGGVWISPEKETTQPPWAAWARAPSPSERSSSSRSAGTSSASVCARCPLSCRWAPLKCCIYWKEDILDLVFRQM